MRCRRRDLPGLRGNVLRAGRPAGRSRRRAHAKGREEVPERRRARASAHATGEGRQGSFGAAGVRLDGGVAYITSSRAEAGCARGRCPGSIRRRRRGWEELAARRARRRSAGARRLRVARCRGRDPSPGRLVDQRPARAVPERNAPEGDAQAWGDRARGDAAPVPGVRDGARCASARERAHRRCARRSTSPGDAFLYPCVRVRESAGGVDLVCTMSPAGDPGFVLGARSAPRGPPAGLARRAAHAPRPFGACRRGVPCRIARRPLPEDRPDWDASCCSSCCGEKVQRRSGRSRSRSSSAPRPGGTRPVWSD